MVIIVIASRYLIDDYQEARDSAATESGFAIPTAAILPISLIAFCGMTGEGALSDWSALYMNEIVGASTALSAVAFGTFGGAMTIGRLFGDRFTDKLGQRKMLLYASVLAFIGLSVALLLPNVYMTFIGFFIAGIGLSNIVPIAYSIAGNTPNVKPAVGIAMASTIGYSGFFIGPPAIGFLAEAFDLRLALMLYARALFSHDLHYSEKEIRLIKYYYYQGLFFTLSLNQNEIIMNTRTILGAVLGGLILWLCQFMSLGLARSAL